MKKELLFISISICTQFLFTVGCSRNIEMKPPTTISDALNEFIVTAPFQYINLDELETQNQNLNRNDIIYSIYDGELHIGHITQVTKNNDRFFLYDGIGNAIFEIKMDRTVSEPLTSEGAGPGEHGIIWNLKSNSQFIFVVDASNLRTNIFTTNMDFVEQKNNSFFFIDLNDELILSENYVSRGIAPINPDQGRIVLRYLNNITDTITTIMPRIVPEGYQPQIYNTPRASLNHHNSIVANYYFLPWLFLFDEQHSLEQTLILEYTVFEEMDIPPMNFFKNLTNEGFGGVRPITEFKLMDNGDIYFTVRKELFHLSKSQDGKYHAVGKYEFFHPTEQETLWITDFFQSDDENVIIIVSWEYIFKFILPVK